MALRHTNHRASMTWHFHIPANAVITTEEAAERMAKADGRKQIAATRAGLRPF